jgi:hypothetical protein
MMDRHAPKIEINICAPLTKTKAVEEDRKKEKESPCVIL